ncbi:MAG: glutaminase A [Oscillospiraceae bacterium]|nr:glutaminase A [Oscillospiraceae bacterium]
MLQETAKAAWEYGRQFLMNGRVADYIPELGKANPVYLGLCIKTPDGKTVEYGDVEQRFTMQSICKVVCLAAALQQEGFDKVFSHVMMEPSGDAFNSILKLDTASNRPFNPMINAGAIEIINLLAPTFAFSDLLEFVRAICMDDDIVLDEAVYRSESETGDRNRAIGYLLKSKDVLTGDVLQTVDLYFKLCSLSITARSLAGLGLVLANGGVHPENGIRLLSAQTVRTVKTLMFTCGMYDRSGEFAVRVGIPCKSGVGGGIMASVENRMGIGTFGPSLDEKGNSIGGGHALEYLSRELHLHIFDSETG